MNHLTYQQIFDAFNSAGQDPEATPSAQLFKAFSANPENMLKALATARTLGTRRQLQHHKTTYLRGLTTALYKTQWQPKHANGLIAATDWLISLDEHNIHGNRYMSQLRIFTNIVQQKISVPEAKKAQWAQRLAKRSKVVKNPQAFYEPEIIYERHSARRSTHSYGWEMDRM